MQVVIRKMLKLNFIFGLGLLLLSSLIPVKLFAVNLLTNGGFNDPFNDIPGRTWNGQNEKIADGWSAFYIEDGTYKPDENAKKLHWMSSKQFGDSFGGLDYHIEGNRAQNMWSSYDFNAGVYQQISGVTPGQAYRFDIKMATFWRGPGYPDTNGVMEKRVGIDPYGGTDPTGENVIWSDIDSDDKAWVGMKVAATAEDTSITVFAKVQAPENDSYAHTDLDMVYLEDSSVEQIDAGPATLLNVVNNGATVNLDWSGSATSGWSLKGYQVRYRDQAGSSWTTLQDNTATDTSGSFTGQLLHTYVVQARTWQSSDGLDLPGPWAEKRVLISAGAVTGSVLDNRGNTINGATVSVSGYATSTTTAGDGSYTLLTGAGTFGITATLGSGWGTPNPVNVTVPNTRTITPLTITLRPANNAIANGDFTTGLTGWHVSGTAPSTSSVEYRTAGSSLKLTGDVVISQTGIISGSYEPVLSFWHKLAEGDGDDVLTAQISGDETVLSAAALSATHSFSTATIGDWQHQWLALDLTELYTGEVGVKFTLAQSGLTQTTVYLDEVSLGNITGGPNKTYLPVVLKN